MNEFLYENSFQRPIVYDAFFIKFEKDGETLYAPLLQKGKEGWMMREHLHAWKARKQTDKHWFNVALEGKFLFTEDELTAAIQADKYIPDEVPMGSSLKTVPKSEYVDWLMKKLKKAMTPEEIVKAGNKVVVVNSNDFSRGWQATYIHNSVKLVETLKTYSHETCFLTLKSPSTPKIMDTQKPDFIIKTKHGYFVKFSSTRIYSTNNIENAKRFKSEATLLSYIDKNSYFGRTGFEILEIAS